MLKRCTECDSFVVSEICGHCGGGRVRATKLGALATVVGSSAFAMTLMACYGMPADEYDRYDAGPDGSSQQDDAGNTDAGNSDAGTDASVSTDAGGDANSLDAGADSADDASTSDAGTDGG